MKIVLAGPFDTRLFRSLSGMELVGAPAGHGGAPVTQLALALVAAGHDVSVVTLDAGIDSTCRFGEGGISVTYCPLRGPPRFKARVRMLDLFAREIAALTAAIAAEGPEIVHAHWTYEYAEAAVRTRLPHLVTMHDLGWDYLFQLRDAYRLMRLAMKYRVMPRVKALTVVSPFMAPKARAYGYFGPVSAIPNGTDVPPIDWSAVERKTGAPLRIVTIGNPGKIKNVEASLAAFAIIKRSRPDAELHLFGPGLGQDYAAAEGLFCHGEVAAAELMRFLASEGTVLAHPSRIETFGMIVAEAKMRGVPVVAGRDSGGVAFVCGTDAGCRLVDIEQPPAIADAVLSLVADPAAYLEQARAARADVEERFAIDGVAALYVDAYRAVLDRRAA